MTQSEARRALDAEFEKLNQFLSLGGMKKYAYAFAKQLKMNELVLETIKPSWREKQVYTSADTMLDVIERAVQQYTYKMRDWGRKAGHNCYIGGWVEYPSTKLENIDVQVYFAQKHYHTYPISQYYSHHFHLVSLDSIIFYDVKTRKLVRGRLAKMQHEIFKHIPESKEWLQKILGIVDVDIRKNVLKQLSWDIMEYAIVIDSRKDNRGEYHLLKLEVKERDQWRGVVDRIYLKMINPSTGETHVEAVHPNCKTVTDAINFRRYGTIDPKGVSNQYIKNVPQWNPTQLS